MKVSINWLKDLTDLKTSIETVVELLPLRTIGTKEITDSFIELDMKGYNRSDLLSMRGVAYEIAAITDSKVTFEEPKEEAFVWVEKSLEKLDVEVEDEKLCPLYCLAKIEGLKIEQSDDTWIQKLSASGIRSINNLTDVTNLVMLEYGQPLHAFDSAAVQAEKIIVRTAKAGEKIVTLDNKDRNLAATDLLITDPEKILGIAGVMGGKNSEIPDQGEVTVLLEAAIFDPVSLRQTSTRLGLTSEASKRFYHGLTKKRLFQALDRAIRLYLELGGRLTGLTIVGSNGEHLKKVPLSLKKVNDLIGVKINKEQVEEYLNKLNFELTEEKNYQGEVGWVVTPPYFRLDIEIEEDLVEEVVRLYGYEKIPPKELIGNKPDVIDQSLYLLISKLKQKLVETGLTEVQTYSFYTTKVLEALNFNENSKKFLVKVANPMSAQTEYMRMNIWPNLVEVIDKNLRHGFEDIAVFEIGKEYLPVQNEGPLENTTLAIALMNGSENPLAELNAIFEKIKVIIAKQEAGDVILATKGSPESGSWTSQDDIVIEAADAPHVVKHLFHPNRFIDIKKDSQRIGGLAEVHPKVLDKMGISKRVAILQILLEDLV